MVRTSKPMTASTVPSTAPSAVPSANAVVTEKKAPSTKKAAAAKEVAATPAKESKTKVAAPVVADAAVESDSAEEGVAAAEGTVESATEKLAAFAALLAAGNNVFVQLKNQFKILEKNIQKELKFAQKVSSRKLKRSGNRKPSGFVCPTLISDELCAFLGQPAGTLMARTVVSGEINAYIRANNLKNVTNGRQIDADAKLTQLLKLEAGDILTFFNLQRYLKSHFIKAEVAASVPAAVVGASV